MILLVNGDALHIPLADESVGCILTSPPYNVGLNYKGYEDKLPDDEFREFISGSLSECYRVLRDNSRAYFVVGDEMLWWFREAAEYNGFRFVQMLTWCKPNLVGGRGRISKDWHSQSEFIILLRKGKRTPMLASTLSNCYNWFVETVDQSNFKNGRIHPAQFPLSLCVKILSRTPGNPILDPFCGSGQVLRAALALDRPAIGIDLVWPTIKSAHGFVNGRIPKLNTTAQIGMSL